MNRLIACAWLGIISAQMSPQQVVAQEKDVALGTQVISATGQLTGIDDSVIKTEVITAEQLEFMQAKVLTDALQHAPGLKIQRTVKSGSKLNIQGADANHVLILKDGLPFISPTGSETDISQIPLLGIDRIEIIKGAGSALYGSSAMAGVINLISKEVDGNSLQLDVSRGIYEEHTKDKRQQESLAASTAFNNTKLSTQLFHKSTPAIDLNDETQLVDGASQDLKSAEVRWDQRIASYDVFLRLNYLNDLKRRDKNDLIYPGLGIFPLYYETDSTKRSIDGGISQLSSAVFDDGRVIFRHEDYEETSGDIDGLLKNKAQRKAEIKLSKIEMQFSKYLEFPLANTFSYGASYQENSMEQAKLDGGIVEVPDKKTKTSELFIQDSMALGRFNEIVAGLRSQHDSDFGENHSAKANWMLTKDRFKLRLSYGMGYRAPNLKERFYLFDHSNLGYIIRGNPDLTPETSDNYHATISYAFDHSAIDFSLFHNDFKNKIETSNTGTEDGISQFVYRNVNSAYTRGIDVTHIFDGERFYWQNSISLLDTRDNDLKRRLENRPRYSFKTQMNYQLTDQLIMSLYGLIEHDRYDGSYDSDNDDKVDSIITSVTDTVQNWDLKFTYKLLKQVDVYGAVENITAETKGINFDTSSENDERQIEPRLFRLGTTLTF